MLTLVALLFEILFLYWLLAYVFNDTYRKEISNTLHPGLWGCYGSRQNAISQARHAEPDYCIDEDADSKISVQNFDDRQP